MAGRRPVEKREVQEVAYLEMQMGFVWYGAMNEGERESFVSKLLA